MHGGSCPKDLARGLYHVCRGRCETASLRQFRPAAAFAAVPLHELLEQAPGIDGGGVGGTGDDERPRRRRADEHRDVPGR